MTVRFYASKCHDVHYKKAFSPENHASGLMLNPNYSSVSISNDCPYIIDSGAFQDVRSEQRLSFEDALNRQLALEQRIGRVAESIVSYDRLVDEQLRGGEQVKMRVDEDIGQEYVEETIKAAEYLVSQRDQLSPRNLILSNQGTTTKQYLDCMSNVLDIAEPTDIIGIGGFCILSKSKQYREQYFQVLSQALPLLADKGIKKIHIFGMSVFPVLIQTDMLCTKYGISIQYDTSSTEVNSVFGRIWDPTRLVISDTYCKDEKYTEYHPNDLAIFNINNITHFWDNYNLMKNNLME